MRKIEISQSINPEIGSLNSISKYITNYIPFDLYIYYYLLYI